MSKRWFNNFVAVCVVILFWAVLFMTAGCAGKGLQLDVKTTGAGDKHVSVSTDYQIENGFTMKRDLDDEDGGYSIELGSATTKDSEMGALAEIMRMMMGMMGYAPPPQAQTNTGGNSIQSVGATRPTYNNVWMDGAGNVWVNGYMNPKLPLPPDKVK